MIAGFHSNMCNGIAELDRNVHSDRENDEYDVISKAAYDANMNISEDRNDGH